MTAMTALDIGKLNLPDDAPHLLVVDDDARIRELLGSYLRQNGFRVTQAENGATARAQMEGLAFDCIILDVMMPGESGFEIAERLRKTSDVPILMLTARS
ncbi:MAG: response regulator, partial [Rhodomicrobium sp.]